MANRSRPHQDPSASMFGRGQSVLLVKADGYIRAVRNDVTSFLDQVVGRCYLVIIHRLMAMGGKGFSGFSATTVTFNWPPFNVVLLKYPPHGY